jgi:hypothetical protein
MGRAATAGHVELLNASRVRNCDGKSTEADFQGVGGATRSASESLSGMFVGALCFKIAPDDSSLSKGFNNLFSFKDNSLRL